MKKVINGKRYDTETAQAMGEFEYSTSGDFHHWYECLYRKKTGEYFLYGSGGPMSKYAEQTGLNNWSGGEAITPLTYKEAQQWAEEYLSGEDYEEIFGEVDESLESISVAYRIPAAAAALITREAEKTGKAQSTVVADLVLKALGPDAE